LIEDGLRSFQTRLGKGLDRVGPLYGRFSGFAPAIVGYDSMNTSQEDSLSNLEPAAAQSVTGLLSLFSGAGGLDCGFEAAGFKVAAAFDLRRDAIASYNHNRPLDERNGHVGNVADLTIQSLDEIVGGRFEPQGIIGGPPCQSFSRATHSADDDPRHDLPLKFAALVSALNARSPVDFFVMENVPGLLKAKHADRLAEFKKRFEEAGFTVTQAVLNAFSFGDVPLSFHPAATRVLGLVTPRSVG